MLSVGPSTRECAKQLKNEIFGFAPISGDTLLCLEGCSSSLFQPVSRQAGSGEGISLPEDGSGPEHRFPCSVG